MTDLLNELKTAVLEGDDVLAVQKSLECLQAGLEPNIILERAIVAGIEEAGHLWEENVYFMPDIILCAEAFKAAMNEVRQLTDMERTNYRGRVLIGTVEGDMHDLGKSIVVAMLSGAGFEVIDLGINVPVQTFIEQVRELKPHILGIGAYMSTTMLLMREIIATLIKEGLRGQLKIIIGGIPTSAEFAAQIGADAWGKDALDAADKTRALMD